MTDLSDRERALENKYALDQEVIFRIESRACKLLALWAAQEMGITGQEAQDYADKVIEGNIREAGLNDTMSRISADLTVKNRPTDQIQPMLAAFLREAQNQINPNF